MTRRSAQALFPLAIGFFVLIVSACVSIWLSERQETATSWVRHTLEVENRLNVVRRLVLDAESGQRGFLLSERAAYLQPYEAATERLPTELEALQLATGDNPVQQANVRALKQAAQTKLYELGGSIELVRLGRPAEAVAVMRTDVGRRYMLRFVTILERMAAEEDRLLALRTASAGWATIASRAALLLSACLVVWLAIFSVREGARRVQALEITNERLRQEALARQSAQSEVRQLQKMEAVGQLTGGIAHDFNNMLAIIIGSLDMARRRLTGQEHPKVAKFIDSAIDGAERAATLTSRLLAFSRRQPLEPKVLDCNKLVAGISEMLRRTLGERIEVETVLAGGLWRVCADPAQIESALLNLAVNARDAMPGGGKLTIETGNAELDDAYARAHEEVTAGHYTVLSISDTGSGMTREIMERAFDPFYTTKGVGKGTGLGLSQVFGFLKQSSGHIKIYSEIGHGTTVKLYFPRYVGKDDTQDVAAAPEQTPLGDPDEIILVVEDEAAVRKVSVDALRELGYTVIHASDGFQALDKLSAHHGVKLLFTDIMMPGMTGRQLADKALADHPELKVLYTTGYTRNAIVHNGMVDYGVALLQKPFALQSLAQKVRDVLNS
ncbi:CHASE3 domain-containing protein [Sphingomonas sp. BIUV-7]|uniref:histidine kinase n=1 Tax=Sphingomonas natans TaxID=3063330 RepID=A0ABT8YE16_9SPHN|nr:CHASE3 domain-containing protein [Sphingomonas sp. BIUV-7]MDO6415815.1 CHASE3 domain-containing protein [Sphingomonas sp. BIUV-7]